MDARHRYMNSTFGGTMSDTISSRDRTPAAPGGKPLFAGVKPVLKLAAFAWLVVWLQAVASAQATTENWVGTDASCYACWNSAANWNPQTVPNGSQYNVVISIAPGPPQPNLDISVTIGNLTIGQNQSLTINGGNQLTVAGSSISNQGILNLGVNGGGTNGYLS